MAMVFWKKAISTKGRIPSNGKFLKYLSNQDFTRWNVGVLEWSKCCSRAEEQVAYTYSDVLAKLFHSMYLVSLRRRKNLMILEELRA